MRKQNPNDVVRAFRDALATSLATWRQLRAAVGEAGPLAKQSSVDGFLRAAVAFENFRSDWHVAAINRDSSAFKADLAQRIEQSVSNQRPALVGRVRIDLPQHPSLSLVRQLLDPKGRNVALSTAATWKDRAARELAPTYAGKIAALPRADDLLVDAVISVRDLLVHQSQSASDAMNDALRGLHGHVDPHLRRGTRRVEPSGIGNYLNAATPVGRRVELFHQRLDEIAQKLIV